MGYESNSDMIYKDGRSGPVDYQNVHDGVFLLVVGGVVASCVLGVLGIMAKDCITHLGANQCLHVVTNAIINQVTGR